LHAAAQLFSVDQLRGASVDFGQSSQYFLVPAIGSIGVLRRIEAQVA